MNNNFPPNTDPNLFTLTAAITGAILAGDFNSLELYSIGNWAVLLGQYLITYAAQLQLIQSRNSYNTNNQSLRNEIDYLMDAVQRIYQELEKTKKV